MAEFDAAMNGNRCVSIHDALAGFDSDPFLWDEQSKLRSVFILWSSGSGANERYWLHRAKFRHLMSIVSTST